MSKTYRRLFIPVASAAATQIFPHDASSNSIIATKAEGDLPKNTRPKLLFVGTGKYRMSNFNQSYS